MAFRKVVFAPTNQKKVQAMNNTTCTKAEASIRKEKTRKVPILNQNFQPRKHPVKKDIAIPGNQTIGVPVYPIIPQPQLLDGVARDIVHGWQQSHWILPTIRHTLFWILPTHGQLDQERQSKRLQKHALYYGITTEFCRCKNPVVFANFATETCWESCIIHFPTTPPCSTRVDVLETGYVPTLFSHPQMKHLGMTIELDPKRDTITCPAFGLYSSPAEYSTMGHFGFGFDESCVPEKIAWADRSKNQRIQLAHENWTKMMTINPLFVQTMLPFLKMKMMSLWCGHHQGQSW